MQKNIFIYIYEIVKINIIILLFLSKKGQKFDYVHNDMYFPSDNHLNLHNNQVIQCI